MKRLFLLAIIIALFLGLVLYFGQSRLPAGMTLVNENPRLSIALNRLTAERIQDSIKILQPEIKQIRIVNVASLPLEGSFDAWRLAGESVKYGAVKAVREGDTLDISLFVDSSLVTAQGWTAGEISQYLGRKLFQGIRRGIMRDQTEIRYPVEYPALDAIQFPSGLSAGNIFKLTIL